MPNELVQLRLAAVADAPELVDIYRPYVEATTISFETVAPNTEEMAERVASTLPEYPWLVAADGNGLLGYAYGHRFAPRAAYHWSVETSIYVRWGAHRHGVGRVLYRVLLDVLVAQGYREALAGIALPNQPSVSFHEAMGFAQVATFRRVGWKLGSWVDIGWWQCKLGGDADDAPIAPAPLDDLDPAAVEHLITGR